jgi:hypothetical protein
MSLTTLSCATALACDKRCAALFICLSLLATVMFPAAMPNIKGDRKIYRNSDSFEKIFDILSPCRSE